MTPIVCVNILPSSILHDEVAPVHDDYIYIKGYLEHDYNHLWFTLISNCRITSVRMTGIKQWTNQRRHYFRWDCGRYFTKLPSRPAIICIMSIYPVYRCDFWSKLTSDIFYIMTIFVLDFYFRICCRIRRETGESSNGHIPPYCRPASVRNIHVRRRPEG